jgi:hypothetical protein
MAWGTGWTKRKTIRAADAKEVGVGNPAEETYRYPNQNPEENYGAQRICQ